MRRHAYAIERFRHVRRATCLPLGRTWLNQISLRILLLWRVHVLPPSTSCGDVASVPAQDIIAFSSRASGNGSGLGSSGRSWTRS
jgi:hypothetical protein